VVAVSLGKKVKEDKSSPKLNATDKS
jgi:hypothetical protein